MNAEELIGTVQNQSEQIKTLRADVEALQDGIEERRALLDDGLTIMSRNQGDIAKLNFIITSAAGLVAGSLLTDQEILKTHKSRGVEFLGIYKTILAGISKLKE